MTSVIIILYDYSLPGNYPVMHIVIYPHNLHTCIHAAIYNIIYTQYVYSETALTLSYVYRNASAAVMHVYWCRESTVYGKK